MYEKHAERYEESASVLFERIIDEGNKNLIDRCKTSIYNYFVLYIAANSK